jgi:hypothetical protein
VDTYVVLDANNVCQDLILWDGVALWSPGAGMRAVAVSTLPPGVQIGLALVNNVWVQPASSNGS